MAFWRAIRKSVGPLHIVARGLVNAITTTEVEAITFTVFPLGGTLPFLLRLRKWLSHQRDITLVWCSDASVTPLCAARYAKASSIPYFVELQGNFFTSRTGQSPKQWLARKLAISAARTADHVRVCTKSHAVELERLSVPAHRISVIPTRVDLAVFDPARYAKEESRQYFLGANESDVVVVGIGNLIRGKGFHNAIEALRYLPSNTRLVLVGDGPERSRLVTFAKRIGVSERTLFLGYQRYNDIPRILAGADIFVLPSYSEGMPRVVHEAAAMECPVVATAIDGIVEQVIEGKTGFLCKPGDPKSLATAITPLVLDPALRRRIGRCARRHVLDHFAFDRVLPMWESTLTRCNAK